MEWTTVAFNTEEQEWRPVTPENGKSDRPDASYLLHGLMANSSDRRLSVDVDREPINVFAVGDRYLFKAYFNEDDVFDVLRPYYNADDYRFEVPEVIPTQKAGHGLQQGTVIDIDENSR